MNHDQLTEKARADYAAVKATSPAEVIATKWTISGLWIWIDGDCRPFKETLKNLGYRWAPVKKQWYFAGKASLGRGGFTSSQIALKYGRDTVTA